MESFRRDTSRTCGLAQQGERSNHCDRDKKQLDDPSVSPK